MKKIKIFTVFLASVGFLIAGSAYAAEIISPSQNEANVTVSASETHKNLYLVGGNATVNSKTEGDLVAAGGMVNIVGDVEQDVMVAGGSLSMTGDIGGDARVAGGNISISSKISGDLVLGGGNVSITSRGFVGGDLVMGAGNVVVDAPVAGSIKIAGGNITINSKVEGDVWVRSEGKNSALIFGPNAEILGKVTYKGTREAVVQEGAKVGTIDFTPIQARKGVRSDLAALFTLALLVKLSAWIIAGLVLVRVIKKFVRGIARSAQLKPWSNLGFGLAGVIAMPIVTVLLFVTLIGYYLGILVGISYAIMLAFSCLLSSLVLGYWILKYLSKKEEVADWQAVVIGVVVWQLLKFIPLVGWTAMLLVFLMTFGAVMLSLKEKISQEN
ncbi:MAG: hypothetical protein COT92_03160 [Candidatus Doudnabacteria bacterium CG10_big_fil_rev_8_21_14_0_10_42_18]|uniref:DUF8173 domain-containing protein n=1 Tax=Candidatus Doudnabacteria bacterium CG10_big_fil_rev_8_21_14_0_10_42_18 TaxID=1974552 RepID=A0A2H0VAF2_9BACT|nr:MAG: hypothetical protein COT92_03160 [Candidatus Doudnabacteria bacterium CG10_big_fil_rev_8_21_14_0_10_42_18]